MNITLSPAQQKSFDQIVNTLPLLPFVGLSGASGAGKTTILQKVREQTGGEWICARDLMHELRKCHPLAIEETFERLVEDALQKSEYVFLDDLSLLASVVSGRCGAYPRPGLIECVYESLSTLIERSKKKLIYACSHAPHIVEQKGLVAHIPAFGPADYEFFCKKYLGAERSEPLDFRRIFRYARSLDGYDLKTVGILLRGDKELSLTTESYIEALRTFGLTSNVNLGEVQQVDLADLKGVDDVVQSLETNVILPLEQIELAERYGLKPKRGVLLAGPPGSGKTTVGRALAHRLKSKFFMIDGTFISGTGDFYYRVATVFEEAKHNSPAVIFIDDGDVIFEGGDEQGLYRYLLTMLDGLESESAAEVCVMMTAMDVANLPPALIRSGRIELWLEMRLPDESARAAILSRLLADLARVVGEVEVESLAKATVDFTGADLKRLVEDGKNLLAYDEVRRMPRREPTEFFLEAIKTVRVNKERYAEAEARARRNRASQASGDRDDGSFVLPPPF